MGNASPFLDWTLNRSAESNYRDTQCFRRGGPLKLVGVELEAPESVDLITELLQNVWVNHKHEGHVKGCLRLAAHQQQDVIDHQFFYDRRYEACGGRRSDVYISHVAIKKAGIRHTSAISTLSDGDVHELISKMGVGWFSSYPRYADALRINGINGPMLLELSDDDLKELGVSNKLHRKRISLEIQSLKEGRSTQTFDIFICSVGFCTDARAIKSKDEVEEMLIAEIRNACKQQEMFNDTASTRSQDEQNSEPRSLELFPREELAPTETKGSKSEAVSNVLSEIPSNSAAPEPSSSNADKSATSPTAWQVGEEVLYFANSLANAPLVGMVVKVHTGGARVKVEYEHSGGSREVTPWVAEGTRLKRRNAQALANLR